LRQPSRTGFGAYLMQSYFITATGTDIGKTFITAGLIKAARAQGMKVDALKPVISGFYIEKPEASDAAVLLEALGRKPTRDAYDAISPWQFTAPLSPDMAARKEGRAIDFDALVSLCKEQISAARNDVLFIEGVGGVMVPINDKTTVLDLIEALAIPVILVSGTYLGAISHLLTALAALASRSIKPHVIVLNETPDASVATIDTIETLGSFCKDSPLAIISRDAIAQPREFDDLFKLVSRPHD